jgi:hypothetical protein
MRVWICSSFCVPMSMDFYRTSLHVLYTPMLVWICSYFPLGRGLSCTLSNADVGPLYFFPLLLYLVRSNVSLGPAYLFPMLDVISHSSRCWGLFSRSLSIGERLFVAG